MSTPTGFPAYKAPAMLTPYKVMVLKADKIPDMDNYRAAFYSWVAFAGFTVLPATFTSLQNSGSLNDSKSGQIVQDAVQNAVQNVPLLYVGCLSCLAGTVGSCSLWYKRRKNYVWLLARIFLPGLLYSIVGLATTLINIYTAKGGHWSVAAKVTVVIVGFYLVAMSVLTLVYDNWLLEKIKTPHDKEDPRTPQ